jgi:RNA polymerase sigma-70 factor (ECF subfamily)
MPDFAAETSQLVAFAVAGDRQAFARLIETHERQSLATAFAVVGCGATAADVVQDAMLRAWQKLGELDDANRFGAWLSRIVRNLAVDTLRRMPRAKLDQDRLALVPVIDANVAEQGELRERLNGALAELDDTTRLAVTLRYFDNLSSREIGEVVGLSAAAVDMRLSRARGLLREKLSCLFPADPPTLAGGVTHGGAV